MLTYDFSDISVPLYEYLYTRLKEDIRTGIIARGEKLPSKRTFAKNNGISTITVEAAYEQLMSEGFVYALPRRGYFVADITAIPDTSKKGSLCLDITVPEKNSGDVIKVDLSDNGTDPDNFPFSVWSRVMRSVITNKYDVLMKPSPTGGVRELRQAISEYLKSFRGMLVDPDQIIVGAGTEYLYGLLIQLLCRNRAICLENPGYHKSEMIYANNGIECRHAGMDSDGIIIDELRKCGADIVHVSPTHHFPTGITMPVSRRYELLSWANEKDDRYIIEDDYDSEFRIRGRPIPPLVSLDGCDRVIHINTFSKTLASTIRISYMILPRNLANLFYRKLSFYSCTVSNFEQYALAGFISGRFFEKHINRMRLHYSRMHGIILECIRNHKLSRHCEVIENDSGLHFILKINTSMDDDVLRKKLLEKGVNIHALSEYYVGSSANDLHRFLINYSNLSAEKMNTALDAIYQCVFGDEARNS